MSAHEWTRARQRSVRREAPPPEREPAPPPPQETAASLSLTGVEESPSQTEPLAEPAAPKPAASGGGVVAEGPETLAGSGSVPVPEQPLPDASAPLPTAPSPGEPVPLPAVVAPPPPRRPSRRRQPRPVARQAELPLGLEPVSEAAARRSATETREELIERLLDPHLSLQETAKLLDVCPTTVRRYTNRGLLAHYRTPGNQRRFRLSDVLAFMERQGIPAHGLERKRTPLWPEPEPPTDS